MWSFARTNLALLDNGVFLLTTTNKLFIWQVGLNVFCLLSRSALGHQNCPLYWDLHSSSAALPPEVLKRHRNECVRDFCMCSWLSPPNCSVVDESSECGSSLAFFSLLFLNKWARDKTEKPCAVNLSWEMKENSNRSLRSFHTFQFLFARSSLFFLKGEKHNSLSYLTWKQAFKRLTKQRNCFRSICSCTNRTTCNSAKASETRDQLQKLAALLKNSSLSALLTL